MASRSEAAAAAASAAAIQRVGRSRARAAERSQQRVNRGEPQTFGDFTLGERLEVARRRSRLSIAEMASEIGVHRNSILAYEKDRTLPTKSVVFMWAAITGFSFDWLSGARWEIEPDPRYTLNTPKLRGEEPEPAPTSSEAAPTSSNGKGGGIRTNQSQH